MLIQDEQHTIAMAIVLIMKGPATETPLIFFTKFMRHILNKPFPVRNHM